MKMSSARYVSKVGVVVMLSLTAWARQAHPILAIGSPAPNFELPGIDGAIHELSDSEASPYYLDDRLRTIGIINLKSICLNFLELPVRELRTPARQFSQF